MKVSCPFASTRNEIERLQTTQIHSYWFSAVSRVHAFTWKLAFYSSRTMTYKMHIFAVFLIMFFLLWWHYSWILNIMAVHPELNRARILRSGSVIIFFFLPRRGTAARVVFFFCPATRSVSSGAQQIQIRLLNRFLPVYYNRIYYN